MSGETERAPSGWTVDTLKEYTEARLKAIEDTATAALENERERTALLEKNSVYWRDQANEWRGTMSDRERNFAQTAELAGLSERVGMIERELAKSRGAAQRSAAILAAFLIVFVPLVVFVANYITR
jgi:hypothetical protein